LATSSKVFNCSVVILLRKTAEAVDFKIQKYQGLGSPGAKRATNFSKIMSVFAGRIYPLLNSEHLFGSIGHPHISLPLTKNIRNQLLVENTAKFHFISLIPSNDPNQTKFFCINIKKTYLIPALRRIYNKNFSLYIWVTLGFLTFSIFSLISCYHFKRL